MSDEEKTEAWRLNRALQTLRDIRSAAAFAGRVAETPENAAYLAVLRDIYARAAYPFAGTVEQ